jgi:hypothetical protein
VQAHPLAAGSRICIIGAGPAGITAAAAYRKAGYRDVVVLEKGARVGGRCLTTARGSDLGAVAWVPWYFDEVTALSDELGIERDWVPLPRSYSVERGRPTWPFSARQMLRAGVESVRYLANYVRWRGVHGPGITEVSRELQQSFGTFLEREGYQSFGETGRVQTSGYGYRWDAPAVYNVRYVSPRGILGTGLSLLLPRCFGGGTGLGFWKGGTQQIWEKLVARDRIDVRTGVEITSIQRGPGGVSVRLADAAAPLRFDALVLACNPRPLLGILDATDEERRLYGRFQTYDYRTYECAVANLGDGRRLYGSFRENLAADRLDRPLVLFKRAPDQDLVVFYVNASGSASDAAIADNIDADLRRVGARLVDVTAAAHHAYAPHVDSDALAGGFFRDVAALQGRNRTIAVGAAFTFDILAHVIAQTRDVVGRHIRGDLAR